MRSSAAWLIAPWLVLSAVPSAADPNATSQPTRPLELVTAARAQVGKTTRYDGTYQRLAYPGGDVPLQRGVCTDVVIRAYRALGIDLQVLVHEDMGRAFEAYPRLWGLSRPDANIDHRRVPNLRTFFARHGLVLPASRRGRDYLAGDLVTWRLNAGVPHIGVVSDRRSDDDQRPLILHNIGLGAQEEDVLFTYEVTGHYRFPHRAPAAP